MTEMLTRAQQVQQTNRDTTGRYRRRITGEAPDFQPPAPPPMFRTADTQAVGPAMVLPHEQAAEHIDHRAEGDVRCVERSFRTDLPGTPTVKVRVYSWVEADTDGPLGGSAGRRRGQVDWHVHTAVQTETIGAAGNIEDVRTSYDDPTWIDTFSNGEACADHAVGDALDWDDVLDPEDFSTDPATITSTAGASA